MPKQLLLLRQAETEFQRLQALNQKVSLIRRADGYCRNISSAWGCSHSLEEHEIHGFRWHEYIEPEDLPRVLDWLRGDSPGPILYRGAGNNCRVLVSLVKVDYGEWSVCGGDSRPWQPGDDLTLRRAFGIMLSVIIATGSAVPFEMLNLNNIPK